MDEAHDSQGSFSKAYVVSTFAVEALALQEALLSASCAGTLEASSNFRL